MTTEQFYALPMNERAVLVAKDIIAQVEVGMYRPTKGHYFNLGMGETPELGGDYDAEDLDWVLEYIMFNDKIYG